MTYKIAAAIAFFSLGANLLGTALLLLFNPHNRIARWWAVFSANIMAWLFLQGLAFATGDLGVWLRPYHAAVHMLPGTFLAFCLIDALGRPTRDGLAVMLLSAIVVAVLIGPSRDWNVADLAWHVTGWGTGTVLEWRWGGPSILSARRKEGRTALILGLTFLLTPVVVLSAILAGAEGFFFYAMPLITVALQFLTFVGVVHLRMYDIEVRAARSGELAAKAAETERLALLGELSSTLAHEIRNPLTGVRSLAQRLAEEEVGSDRLRRYAAVILEEMGRVERLVVNLLGLARRGQPSGEHGETTALGPLFDDLLLLVRPRAQKTGVTLVADAERLQASAPREALAQALLNLLLNAIAHTPPGGRVELAARSASSDIEVGVSDQGPGVPASERERIFEPFYSRTGGTGLGLAVVRRLARELGWTVAVGDAPGGGAQFTLRIPHTPQATQGASETCCPPPAESMRVI